MEIIGLFGPAIVSLMVGHMLNDKKTWKMPKVLFEYGLYVLANALLSICVITYVLRMDDVGALPEVFPVALEPSRGGVVAEFELRPHALRRPLEIFLFA